MCHFLCAVVQDLAGVISSLILHLGQTHWSRAQIIILWLLYEAGRIWSSRKGSSVILFIFLKAKMVCRAVTNVIFMENSVDCVIYN